MNEISNKNVVVFYHAGCPDGFSGAWVARKKFGEQADYTELHFEELINIDNKEIYFIDIVPQSKILKDVIARNKSVVVIDHHVSNEPALSLLKNFKFDISKSGSALAWGYFFPDKPIPTLLSYVQDVDLWAWKLPSSNEIASYVDLLNLDFAAWDKFAADMDDPVIREEIIKNGALLNKYKDNKIEDMIKHDAQTVEFEGFRVLAANSPVLGSLIGNALVKKHPPMGIVWFESRHEVNVSLRSDRSVDVSLLAEKYGGGGHKAAAGFRLPLGAEKPWKIIRSDNDEK